jgi:hypothetical protein
MGGRKRRGAPAARSGSGEAKLASRRTLGGYSPGSDRLPRAPPEHHAPELRTMQAGPCRWRSRNAPTNGPLDGDRQRRSEPMEIGAAVRPDQPPVIDPPQCDCGQDRPFIRCGLPSVGARSVPAQSLPANASSTGVDRGAQFSSARDWAPIFFRLAFSCGAQVPPRSGPRSAAGFRTE